MQNRARAGACVRARSRTGLKVATARMPTPELDAKFKGKRECQGKGKGAWLIRCLTK